MQVDINVLQISLALLFIFGGLVFLNRSTRVSRKMVHLAVVYPDDEDYQAKISRRERETRRVVTEWKLLVLLELVSCAIGGYLAIGFFGSLFFVTMILSSHYINRRKIPRTDYDPLVELANRILVVDIHGNTSLHNAKNAILQFIQQRKLTGQETTRLLDYLIQSMAITNEIESELIGSIGKR